MTRRTKVDSRPVRLFLRDSKSNLLPQLVPLLKNDLYGIVMIPLIKGQINEVSTMVKNGKEQVDITKYILNKCLLTPKINLNDKNLNLFILDDIINTILFESGVEVKQQTKHKKSKRRLNYEQFNFDFNIATEMYFCFSKGISFEQYVKLTQREIELLGQVSLRIQKINSK